MTLKFILSEFTFNVSCLPKVAIRDAWGGGFFFTVEPAAALHSPSWSSSDKQSRDTVPKAQVLPRSPKGMLARGSDQLRLLLGSRCTDFFVRISRALPPALGKASTSMGRRQIGGNTCLESHHCSSVNTLKWESTN